MSDEMIFNHANIFTANFNSAKDAGCSFVFVDEESECDIESADEFIKESKNVEICMLTVTLPSGDYAGIHFVADEGVVRLHDYSVNEELEQFFSEFFDLED